MAKPNIRGTTAKEITNRNAGRVRTDTLTSKNKSWEERYNSEEMIDVEELLNIDVDRLSILSRDDVETIIKQMLEMMETVKMLMEEAYKNGDYKEGHELFEQWLKLVKEIRMYAKDLAAEETKAREYLIQQKLREVLAKKHKMVTEALSGGDEEVGKIVIQVPDDIEQQLQELLEKRNTGWLNANNRGESES